MASYPVALRMVGAVVSIEITDGHGTWSLGKRTLFSQEITTQVTTGAVTIDEKTNYPDRRSACNPTTTPSTSQLRSSCTPKHPTTPLPSR
jgi:hypothetical protein